ncbi:hypothetical protein A9G49_05175 [Aeromonas sp. ANP5]|nr:hypothetical protein A9G04_05440 [Aeromonas sp. ANNP30]OEC66406.1 hypothetical protein A9G49_05175 [Aeromonas sp. ANP5]
MWAHYANNHEGFCIGYDSELFKEETSSDEQLPISTSAVKMKYNNCRFDFTNTSIDISKNHNDKLKSILFHVLTTKSDEWIYEKEYRIILPLKNCDDVIYLGSNENTKKDISLFQPNNYQGSYVEISNKKDFMFTKRISKKSIKSIHFGCRIDMKTENHIIDKILSDDEYKHVLLYKYEPNPNRFELENKCFNYALRNKNPLAL